MENGKVLYPPGFLSVSYFGSLDIVSILDFPYETLPYCFNICSNEDSRHSTNSSSISIKSVEYLLKTVPYFNAKLLLLFIIHKIV